jgi:hypothetical protein
LLPAIRLPFAAALAPPQVPPRCFILVALLLVLLMAEQARQEPLPADPGPDWLRHLPTLLSSRWSGGKAFISVRVIAVPSRLARSRYAASPVYPGDASG